MTLNKIFKIFSMPEITDNIGLQISQFIEYLQKNKCLIIFDDIQNIFMPKQFAGEYQIGYENYRVFFDKIADNNHQSCLLLNSNETFGEIDTLENHNSYVKSLVLKGLDMEGSKNICQDYQLSNPEDWETLVKIYDNNPSLLKLTAHRIKNDFKGKVADFLTYQQPVLCEYLQTLLEQQFKFLTNYEKTIITLLAYNSKPMLLSDFNHKVQLSDNDLLNAILSLSRRFLIKTTKEKKITKYSLNSVIKEYIKFNEARH